jgi:Skp family chaperone for outer membrane proteins
MKSIQFIAASLFFAVLLVASVTAQTVPATGTTKIAIVKSDLFSDPKLGISRYVQAFKTLEAEFKPRQDEITALGAKLETLVKEIETLNRASVADTKSIEAKREQGERLQIEYKYKQDQYKSALERRYPELMRPIQDDIGRALADFSKQRGFQIVFDRSKDENNMLIWADLAAVDITNDFIKFYNARPATSTTVAPK